MFTPYARRWPSVSFAYVGMSARTAESEDVPDDNTGGTLPGDNKCARHREMAGTFGLLKADRLTGQRALRSGDG